MAAKVIEKNSVVTKRFEKLGVGDWFKIGPRVYMKCPQTSVDADIGYNCVSTTGQSHWIGSDVPCEVLDVTIEYRNILVNCLSG